MGTYVSKGMVAVSGRDQRPSTLHGNECNPPSLSKDCCAVGQFTGRLQSVQGTGLQARQQARLPELRVGANELRQPRQLALSSSQAQQSNSVRVKDLNLGFSKGLRTGSVLMHEHLAACRIACAVTCDWV